MEPLQILTYNRFMYFNYPANLCSRCFQTLHTGTYAVVLHIYVSKCTCMRTLIVPTSYYKFGMLPSTLYAVKLNVTFSRCSHIPNYAPSYGSVYSIIMDVCQYENCIIKHNKQNKMYFVLTIVVPQCTPLSNPHEDDSVLKVQNEMIKLL